MFKIFEIITEVFGWLRIMASPLLIGLAIGAFIYFPDPTLTKLIVGIIVSTLGLTVGIIWANKKWKGKGTIQFLSKILATPELDDLKKEENIQGK